MKNTHNLSLDTMINHAKAVRQGIKKSLLVVDMPKDSYKKPSQAINNAKLIIKKTGCDAIKIENNPNNLKIVKSLINSNINVMGHIGYTPQFKKKFRVEGKKLKEQKKLQKHAKDL
jgi:3-methyl-2-oxobutanoate hydroxymethyltransferase